MVVEKKNVMDLFYSLVIFIEQTTHWMTRPITEYIPYTGMHIYYEIIIMRITHIYSFTKCQQIQTASLLRDILNYCWGIGLHQIHDVSLQYNLANIQLTPAEWGHRIRWWQNRIKLQVIKSFKSMNIRTCLRTCRERHAQSWNASKHKVSTTFYEHI